MKQVYKVFLNLLGIIITYRPTSKMQVQFCNAEKVSK